MGNAEQNETDRAAGSRYNREFAPAFIGYIVVTIALIILVDFDDAAWWKYLIAVAPLVPALWGVRAVARHIGRIDEMQQRVQLSAMAGGFGVAMVVSMTVGFLANAGLDTNRWGPWAIYATGMLTWAVVGVRKGVAL